MRTHTLRDKYPPTSYHPATNNDTGLPPLLPAVQGRAQQGAGLLEAGPRRAVLPLRRGGAGAAGPRDGGGLLGGGGAVEQGCVAWGCLGVLCGVVCAACSFIWSFVQLTPRNINPTHRAEAAQVPRLPVLSGRRKSERRPRAVPGALLQHAGGPVTQRTQANKGEGSVFYFF